MLLEQELIELIKNNKIKFYKVAWSILNNEEDVNDAIQEMMISAYNKLDSLKNKKYMQTWITRILINKCYDIIDKNKNQESKVNRLVENYEEKNIDFEQKSIVQKAITLIDEDLKTIVVLYYYNQFSVKEISKIMDIPTGTVKSKLSRARLKLYDILKSEVEENE